MRTGDLRNANWVVVRASRLSTRTTRGIVAMRQFSTGVHPVFRGRQGPRLCPVHVQLPTPLWAQADLELGRLGAAGELLEQRPRERRHEGAAQDVIDVAGAGLGVAALLGQVVEQIRG